MTFICGVPEEAHVEWLLEARSPTRGEAGLFDVRVRRQRAAKSFAWARR